MSQELTKRLLSSIVLIPLAIFFIIKGSLLFNLFLSVCFFITIYEWHTMTRNKQHNILGLIFLILSFYSIYKIRNDFDNKSIYLIFVTIICVATDIGGYFFGKIFKGPKLTKISPKKTYSGSIGGYLFSMIFISMYINFEKIQFTKEIFIFIFLISTVSKLGDILI